MFKMFALNKAINQILTKKMDTLLIAMEFDPQIANAQEHLKVKNERQKFLEEVMDPDEFALPNALLAKIKEYWNTQNNKQKVLNFNINISMKGGYY